MMNLTENNLQDLKDNVDQIFVVLMGIIVMLMQAGFAFLEAGSVRSKNTTNILIKNLLDSFVAGITYWIVGYTVAYGKGNSFIGWTYWASHDLPLSSFGIYFFQYTFAATAATIVSGALAERCEFMAYIVYSIVITGFIYPVVSRWAWDPAGWLFVGGVYTGDNGEEFNVNYQDYAGSGAVHALGGVAALVGAALLGPRKGRFSKQNKMAVTLRGHSVPVAAFGGFILLFGFLAFNGGSQLDLTGEGSAVAVSLSVVNTMISGSVSAMISLLMNRVFGDSKWSLLKTLNGALTGMVATCSGCNVYRPWSCAILGLLGAGAFKLTAFTLEKLYIDDPLDVVGVHLGGGIIGVIALAFLKPEEGIIFQQNRKSALFLGWQILGLTTIIVWTAGLCFIMFGILKLFDKLRVSPELEEKGLDIPKHGENAYPSEAYGHGWEKELEEILQEIESIKGDDLKGNLTKRIGQHINKSKYVSAPSNEFPEVNPH
ncbi:hypothetical protein SNE40_003280 [Patella caerulea]|uniref:Ammonium transporter n=1 Tax=Patella caerulea TaxID=87958 RepID=A0AAN8Q0Q1_PATCE